MKKTTYHKSCKICPHYPLIFVLFELPVYRESGCQQQNTVIVCMFTQDYAFSNWSQSYPPPPSPTHPSLLTINILSTLFKFSRIFMLILVYKGPMRNGSRTRDFQLQVFFHGSVSFGSLSIPIEPFQFFSKICGNIQE
jgi:hypothetical protein